MEGWNLGDLISLAVGVVFCGAVSLFREKARNKDAVIQNFATGTAIGPLALILLSPVAAVWGALGYKTYDLLKLATEEARVALVFSAFIAAVYMVDSALPGRGR